MRPPEAAAHEERRPGAAAREPSLHPVGDAMYKTLARPPFSVEGKIANDNNFNNTEIY